MGPTTEHIDRRYSDENAELVAWTDAEATRSTPARGHAKGDPFTQTTYRF